MSVTLESLPSITRLSSTVTRVLGQNPGKFTLQGTNTYLIGARRPYILLDSGEGKPEYIPHLEQALRNGEDSSPPLSDIIVTHRHHDHYGGIPSIFGLLRRLSGDPSGCHLPRIHLFPFQGPDKDPIGDAFCDVQTQVSDLAVGQTFQTEGASLVVLHTPGHTADSVCLYMKEGQIMFTADTVLGQGTTVFEDLASYMDSLRQLVEFKDEDGKPLSKIYPGHGPVIEDGIGTMRMYIAHRQQREDDIINLLKTDSQRVWTLHDIVSTIYAEYPQSLWAPASRSITLHLEKLRKEGSVSNHGGEEFQARWKLGYKI